jgi:hypothetical protein
MNKILLALLLSTSVLTSCDNDEETTDGNRPLTTVAGGATCKGVVCPNGGSCHLEQDKPICIDACAAVRCANGPCVVKDGRPVCTDQRADAGSGPSDCRTEACKGTDTCEPCKTTTGAAYICLPRGTAC